MRRLLTITLAIISFAFAALPTQASIKSEAAALYAGRPQIYVQFGHRRHWRNDYVNSRIESRVVYRGWRTYRETYRVMYYPDGEVRTQLICRDRIG